MCCARSNVAALNIAHALKKAAVLENAFRLVVSHEYHFDWHEERYRELEEQLITSDVLRKDPSLGYRLQDQMKVLTLSMLCSKKLKGNLLHGRSVVRLMVDEASQARHFHTYGPPVCGGMGHHCTGVSRRLLATP